MSIPKQQIAKKLAYVFMIEQAWWKSQENLHLETGNLREWRSQ